MMILSWFLTSLFQKGGSANSQNSATMEDSQSNLTEPLLDASYLDDELGLMLTADLTQSKILWGTDHLTLTNSTNNNTHHHQQQKDESINSITGSILDQLNFNQDIFGDDFVSQEETPSSTTTTPSSSSTHPLAPHPTLTSLTTFSTDSLDKSLLSLKKSQYTLTFNDNFNTSHNLPDLAFLRINSTLPVQKSANLCKTSNLSANSNAIPDFASLCVLLPSNYTQILANHCKKPQHLRERETEEKEKDEKEDGVKLRKKRHSLGEEEDKNKARFKRFSLQEIQEVGEVCRGIEETLKVLEGGLYDRRRKKEVRDNRESSLTQNVTAAIANLSKKTRSKVYSNSTHAKALQETLCPALYSIFSDGLCPWIETLFGRVPNGVWRVVEASVAGAPTTQILSELVLRINSESELMGDDGPLKFNAFVSGLLNLGTLPSYLDLLRTKDRLLRTHYTPNAYLYSVNTTNRGDFDIILNQTKVLNRIRYDLDIFYETKLLHCRINSLPPTSSQQKMKRSYSDERPLTKLAPKEAPEKIPKSKTSHNIDKIGKFKKLQLQWEMMASQEKLNRVVVSPTSGSGVSRIPRLIMGREKERAKSAVVVGVGRGWRK